MKHKQLLYQSLYLDILDKIKNQTYPKNTYLPSIRSCANKLGYSTTTIERAYNQLLAEGYITSIPRSGYKVISVDTESLSNVNQIVDPIKNERYQNNQLTMDLFDIKGYKSIINSIVNYNPEKLYSECNPLGEIELREEIRKYVFEERNVICDVNQILIGPGVQSLLQFFISMSHKATIGYLYPEFKKALDVFRDFGYIHHGYESLEALSKGQDEVIYISPSNIYPFGDVIKMSQRIMLLKKANERDAIIIEDDYNYFIRYNDYVVPSIYSIAKQNNVVYLGSFAKMLLPSIRISFMIIPMKLYDSFKNHIQKYTQGVSKLEQLSLAKYMKEGLFKRHTKRLFHKYKEKNAAIVNAILPYQKKYNFEILGIDSNLHLIIHFKQSIDAKAFINKAKQLKFKTSIIDGTNFVIFPYSGIENSMFSTILDQLFS